ncbi:MAG TPA: RNA methyltransferase [Candidatus Baltobacteraceae bacterium]|nr:RNA methyltransferase [Candidatus Baltobacteraceae bacterium]
MPVRLGVHADRLTAIRTLHAAKGRRQSGRFAFEGPTLLREAHANNFPIEEIYATQEAYDAEPLVAQLEAAGTAAFVIEPRSAQKISDLETPPGIVAVSAMKFATLEEIFGGDGVVLVLADLNDPGNAGTLLRTADAFGCRGAVAGSTGTDPYHPKVVRAAMGALFRLPVAVAQPDDVARAAAAAGFEVAGLAAKGEPLGASPLPRRAALAVGNERHGLGRWEAILSRRLAIPMLGRADSLNAAVAGSIALYEATKAAGVPLPVEQRN